MRTSRLGMPVYDQGLLEANEGRKHWLCVIRGTVCPVPQVFGAGNLTDQFIGRRQATVAGF